LAWPVGMDGELDGLYCKAREQEGVEAAETVLLATLSTIPPHVHLKLVGLLLLLFHQLAPCTRH
jgi:hypothetical protein